MFRITRESGQIVKGLVYSKRSSARAAVKRLSAKGAFKVTTRRPK